MNENITNKIDSLNRLLETLDNISLSDNSAETLIDKIVKKLSELVDQL